MTTEHHPRSKGRTGRPYRRARARVLRASTVCWLCGEDGADTVDHVVPVSELTPGDPLLTAESNLRPAHRECNSRRGNGRRTARELPTSRRWL